MLPKKLVFLDTETTGMSVVRDRIIEIGLLRVEDGKVVDKYQTLLNPDRYLPPQITVLTGIQSEDLLSAPLFEDIVPVLQKYLDDAVLVAHNVRFDYGFLRQEFARTDVSFTTKHFCSAKLSRKLFPAFRHHNLDSIIERFGFACEKRHRAFDDAEILWKFYQKVQKKIAPEKFEQVVAELMQRPYLPEHISKEDIGALTDGPGVYIFYGEQGMPLYVGKSNHVRERVLSHFSNDYSRSTEMHMSRQVTHIETIPTGGEFSALLKESELIKSLQPLYNRKSRLKQTLFKLSVSKHDDDYKTISLDQVHAIYPEDIPYLVGIFPSQKNAKEYLLNIRKEYQLCDKLLGFEKTKGACFPYRLGECKGACINEEPFIKYNMRLIQAISAKKIKPWPFPGPIRIVESYDEHHAEVGVDNWCLMSDDSQKLIFDKDMYHILLSYLKNPKNNNHIRVLKS